MLQFPNKPHNGGAKDGEFEMSLGSPESMGRVEPVARLEFACPQSLAIVRAVDGHLVRWHRGIPSGARSACRCSRCFMFASEPWRRFPRFAVGSGLPQSYCRKCLKNKAITTVGSTEVEAWHLHSRWHPPASPFRLPRIGCEVMLSTTVASWKATCRGDRPNVDRRDYVERQNRIWLGPGSRTPHGAWAGDP